MTIGGHLIPAGTPMVLPLGVLLSDEQYFPNIDKQVFLDDWVWEYIYMIFAKYNWSIL